MSLVFFFFFIVGALMSIIPFQTSEIRIVLPSFVALISFSASLLWLRMTKKDSKVWYFGIPQSITLLILIFSDPLDLLRGGHNLDYFTIVLGILSITSIGFFLSLPDSQRIITRWFALISGVIGVYAVFVIYYLIQGVLSPGGSGALAEGLEIIYWIILMPLIGLCYGATALMARDSDVIQTND